MEETAKRLDEALPLVESPAALDLEDLERRLTILEEKLTAALSADADEEALLAIRREISGVVSNDAPTTKRYTFVG